MASPWVFWLAISEVLEGQMRIYGSVRAFVAMLCIALLGVLLVPVAGATHANVNCDGVFDEFGYECSEVPLNWIDAAEEVALDTNGWGQVELPFEFPYYGSMADRLWLNGEDAYLTFQPPPSDPPAFYSLPDYGSPDSVISVLGYTRWDPAQSSYRFEVVGTAPDRIAVIEFDLSEDQSEDQASATAQAQLHENGDVDLLYAGIQQPSQSQGLIGMEDWQGRVGGTVFHHSLSELAIPRAFQFAYPADPPSYPVLGRDDLVVDEGASASFNVLDNDYSPDGLPLEVVDYGWLNSYSGEIGPSSHDFVCDVDGDCTLNLDPDGTYDFSLAYEASNGTLSSFGEIDVDRVPVDDGPPVAVLDVVQGTADEISIVQLSAFNSQAPDAIERYRWDLNGDGTVDTETTTTRYDWNIYGLYAGGTYSPTVTIVDSDGQSDTAGLAAPMVVGDVDGDAFAFLGERQPSDQAHKTVEGAMTAGDLSIARDQFGISSVNGSATLSTTAGDRNVTINVNRFWILPIHLGQIRIPEAGIDAFVFTGLLDGGDTVWGKAFYWGLGAFMNLEFYWGTWALKDGS
ncbi:MAG: hypothetical protein JJLCMIEE_02885 [Acidimicrobiales bacterium]|nr:MAG: hypothetical protein EDR02_15005 [Actinomycetota bacterium]MBV6509786.1 hypothetical protein [Acidimicrobiales bacterium]RIK04386.1 MAG: hypothetical protein DCC48_13480 [Acidobacteriota bacterium]